MLGALLGGAGARLFARRRPRRFTVTLIRPQGNSHAEVFREIAENLLYGLRRLGYSAAIVENTFAADATAIVLGSHMLREEHVARIPRSAILYNFEQIHPGVPTLRTFIEVLAPSFRVWDYSARNVATLERIARPRSVRRVPIGYSPELSRIAPAPEQDIDVFFSGAISERRARVLDALRAEGLRVVSVSSVYGAERDALIARSKVVLNLHYRAETRIFEVARVFYLLANRKAVVTELGPSTEIEDAMREAVLAAPYEELAAAACALVADASRRRELERRGFERFLALSEAEILRVALAAEAEG
jgi:hypothetical protein